jgi:hypothetical protein
MAGFSKKEDANGPHQEFTGSAGKGKPGKEKSVGQEFDGSAAKGKKLPSDEKTNKPNKLFG